MDRIRNYKHEYETRKKKQARLQADMNKETVIQFKGHLKARGLTFVKWLDGKIKEELGEGKNGKN